MRKLDFWVDFRLEIGYTAAVLCLILYLQYNTSLIVVNGFMETLTWILWWCIDAICVSFQNTAI